MNKRLDLTKLGGYPLTQKDLDWMQVSYRAAFAAIGSLIGNNVIISGMAEVAGSVTAGWVSIAGELVPFQAGTIGTGEFIIEETSTSLTFKDGISKVVRIERIARFSSGGSYQYSNLTRPTTIKEVWQKYDVKQVDCDMTYLNANFDANGLGINERVGWAVCNGNNGTRNRKGRVSIQLDPADPTFETLGLTGGAKTHNLLIAQLPTFTVTTKMYKRSASGNDGGKTLISSTPTGDEINFVSNPIGSGEPHNILDPYQVTLFIQKL